MGANYKVTYNVDVVLVIDVTGSMVPVLDLVKKNALSFHGDLTKKMEEKKKVISNLRLRIVAFRDFIADGNQALLATEFMNLPENADTFEELINGIEADGGGDEPEDGLEALAVAMKSKWNKPSAGNKCRQVIVVWSDASTHKLGYGKSAASYPTGMPADFSELVSWWDSDERGGYMNEDGKRLLLYTPEASYWNEIVENFNNTLFFPSEAGKGLAEYDYKEIIDTIASSIAGAGAAN